MYNNDDLERAVQAQIFTSQSVQKFKDFIQNPAPFLSETPDQSADEEPFRLVSSFNDIFVTIASLLVIGALIAAFKDIPILASLIVAMTAWGLAEFFVRKKNMALPAIVLLVAFMGGIASSFLPLFAELEHNPTLGMGILFGGFGVTLIAAWLHWKRFYVPITIAVGSAATGGFLVGLIAFILDKTLNISSDNLQNIMLSIILSLGFILFLWALRWDFSDRARETRRSDVAFWLHLFSAPMMIHSLFGLLGLFEDSYHNADNINHMGLWLNSILVFGVYFVLGVISLIIDRRALMVSGLGYVVFILFTLLDKIGNVELSFSITGILIGTMLLLLSAFWQNSRRFVLKYCPAFIQNRVPPLNQ